MMAARTGRHGAQGADLPSEAEIQTGQGAETPRGEDRQGSRVSALRILSLGAGVQSTTVALMCAHGEIEPPDCAIFADTQWEPAAVYDHLAWLRSPNVLPFPVHVVTEGDIRQAIRDRRNPTEGHRFVAIPWWTISEKGKQGKGRRQCTSEYKLTPIMREIRRILGKPGRAYIAPGTVIVMLGISHDEAHRMKPAKQRYMVNTYPLIDRRMTREDCLRWLRSHDYPQPPKSACIGCPYHSDAYWRTMRDSRPTEWADALDADRALRIGNSRGMRVTEFMHRARIPLGEVDLTLDDRQGDLFGEECEGMCGV